MKSEVRKQSVLPIRCVCTQESIPHSLLPTPQTVNNNLVEVAKIN